MDNSNCISRNQAIDVAKAIGILLMIFAHCEIPWLPRKVIHSFHMPLFLIFSGYFFREQEPLNVVSKGLTHLVKPYFITSAVCITLSLTLQDYSEALYKVVGVFMAGGGHFFHNPVPIIGPIWFLLALFWCKLFYVLIYKKTMHYFEWSFVISTLSFIIGKYVSTLPLGILYGGCSLVFYSMGHLWKQKGVFLDKTIYLLIGVAIWISTIFCKGFFGLAEYSCNLYPISMFAAFVGTYVVYLISSKISVFLPRITHVLQWIGQNTLLILCYHTIYFSIMRNVNKYIFIPNGITTNLWQDIIICYFLSLGLPILHVIIRDKILPKFRSA